MTRQFNVTKEEVETAWKAVRRAGGAAGYDRQTIEDVEKDLENQLYKIWNRMSSGSLQAQPVLLVEIPKAKGGFRQLGIPTVTDRVAQMVIKNRLEPILEAKFHKDSYAYRPNKSALDAVGKCRERCFKYEWAVEVDIKAFFDTIDHAKMLEILGQYTTDKTVILYAKKFLQAQGRTESGEAKERKSGTPQGGVISPILANLYLHEVFDLWMEKNFPEMEFERYADDIIVHCTTEAQGHFIKERIKGRLERYSLEMHPEKTKVTYTGKSNKHDGRGHGLSRKFTFLGYDFKPRFAEGGRPVFTPGIGKGAIKAIRQKINKEWWLKQRIGWALEDIAREVNAQIRGWINYYGKYRRSELYLLGHMINNKLAGFLKRKHKSMKSWAQSWEGLKTIQGKHPKLFCHWYMICSKR